MSGELYFSYDRQWISSDRPAISFSMPVSEQSFGSEITKNFFGNFMPENTALLSYMRSKLRITHDNLFMFLTEYGLESAGALIIVEEGRDVSELNCEYRDITDKLIIELKKDPENQIDLIIALDAKISLAGAQNKLPVRYENGKFLISADNSLAATSHVIKPPHRIFKGLPYNEAFCMELARRVGIPVPMSDIVNIGGAEVFITERYDRAVADGRVIRYHQEDFCQALGINHALKYEIAGGPGFRDCIALLNRSGVQKTSVVDFARVAIFNVIIANHDAHAKNFSFLYNYQPEIARDGTGVTLAPFYDLVCTGIYPLNESFAMSIGGISYFHELDDDAYRQFAGDLSLPYNALSGLINDTIGKVRASVSDIVQSYTSRFGNEDIFIKIFNIITNNCKIMEKASDSLNASP